MNDTSDDRPFHVLFVCTANLCRSPLAEHVARAVLAEYEVGWELSSAGVIATDGRTMHPHAAAVLDERGLRHDGWSTRRLTARQVAAADLVLTAEVAHRQTVVTIDPAAVRRTFTVLQFAHLVGLVEPSTDPVRSGRDVGTELIRRAEVGRSRPQSRDQRLLELADPLRRPVDAFRATADQLEAAVRGLLAPVLGTRAAGTAVATG